MIAVVAAIMDSRDVVQEPPVSCIALTLNNHHDAAGAQSQKFAFLLTWEAGGQLFNAMIDGQTGALQLPVKRETWLRHDARLQSEFLAHGRRQERIVNCDWLSVGKPQPIQSHEIFAGREPCFGFLTDCLEGQKLAARTASGREDEIRKAAQLTGQAFQGLRRDIGAFALSTHQKAVIDKRLDGFGHRKTTDAEVLRQLRLTRDPIAWLQPGDLAAQIIGEPTVKRPVVHILVHVRRQNRPCDQSSGCPDINYQKETLQAIGRQRFHDRASRRHEIVRAPLCESSSR